MTWGVLTSASGNVSSPTPFVKWPSSPSFKKRKMTASCSTKCTTTNFSRATTTRKWWVSCWTTLSVIALLVWHSGKMWFSTRRHPRTRSSIQVSAIRRSISWYRAISSLTAFKWWSKDPRVSQPPVQRTSQTLSWIRTSPSLLIACETYRTPRALPLDKMLKTVINNKTKARSISQTVRMCWIRFWIIQTRSSKGGMRIRSSWLHSSKTIRVGCHWWSRWWNSAWVWRMIPQEKTLQLMNKWTMIMY